MGKGEKKGEEKWNGVLAPMDTVIKLGARRPQCLHLDDSGDRRPVFRSKICIVFSATVFVLLSRVEQAQFDKLPGVISSSVGYTGGNSSDPTYDSVCRGDGHTEALKVEYDPSVISYEDLMQRVLEKASVHPTKAQYKSAVWAQSDEQAAAARSVAAKLGKEAVPVLEAAQWHDAEEYHQKYVEKSQQRFAGW